MTTPDVNRGAYVPYENSLLAEKDRQLRKKYLPEGVKPQNPGALYDMSPSEMRKMTRDLAAQREAYDSQLMARIHKTQNE